MNFRNKLQETSQGFPMAPMVDVMFCLLIFFITALVYAQWENKIGIQVPTAETGTEGQRNQGEIIINLDADGKIFVNSQELSALRLQGVLERISRTFKGQPVIIRADRATDYEKVVAVLDICRLVDIYNVSFATLPTSDEGGAAPPAPAP
jgi:biopolymer transport protein ExbD